MLMPKSRRQYYERNNSLIQQYTFIDRLLDSSLPHDLIQEYQNTQAASSLSLQANIPETISEEAPSPMSVTGGSPILTGDASPGANGLPSQKVKRTPKN